MIVSGVALMRTDFPIDGGIAAEIAAPERSLSTTTFGALG